MSRQDLRRVPLNVNVLILVFFGCLEFSFFQFSSQELNADVKIVTLKWLENCFKRGRVLETEPYEIPEQKKDSDL